MNQLHGSSNRIGLENFELAPFSEIYSTEQIRVLVQDFEIPEELALEFEEVLGATYKTYQHLMLSRSEYGKLAGHTEDARSLRKHFERLVELLRVPGIKARVDRAAAELSSRKGDWATELDLHCWNETYSNVERMLAIAATAENLDGHRLKGLLKSKKHIRVAAKWIVLFWRVVLGRPKSLQERGSVRTRALQFVISCMDPLVRKEYPGGLNFSVFRDIDDDVLNAYTKRDGSFVWTKVGFLGIAKIAKQKFYPPLFPEIFMPPQSPAEFR